MTQQLTVREQVRSVIEEAVENGLLGMADEWDIDDITNEILAIPTIAAAPDLLEALREILSEFEGNYDGIFYDAVSALRIQGISRNAIAKATQ